jgi:hypothetical protein
MALIFQTLEHKLACAVCMQTFYNVTVLWVLIYEVKDFQNNRLILSTSGAGIAYHSGAPEFTTGF